MRLIAVGLVVAVVALGGACSSTGQAAQDCLDRDVVRTISGLQTTKWRAMTTPDLPSYAGVDATTAQWIVPGAPGAESASYPVIFNGSDSDSYVDNCLVGGYVEQVFDHGSSDWDVWHDAAGVTAKRPGLAVIATTLHNVGDALRFAPIDGRDWAVRGVHATRVHDDCVENDGMYNGLVDDSFFDGCYVFYSARDGFSPTPPDGHNNTVTISNSLIRMEAMPDTAGSGPFVPGHGPIWKMSGGTEGISPMLAVHSTIVRVDQRPAGAAKLGIPEYDPDLYNGGIDDEEDDEISYLDTDACTDNVLVWTGPTNGPGAMTQTEIDSYERTGCWVILTGQAGIDEWNERVATWIADHDYATLLAAHAPVNSAAGPPME